MTTSFFMLRSAKATYYATALSNCPKSNNNGRIITVEYTVGAAS